ncbi:hypothetical protein D1007_28934 [Hordeum vulgare]|nr:hypothetical protein D1007_28934 [Hordeum vulgare]
MYKIWLTGAWGIAVATLRRRQWNSVLVVGDKVDVDLVVGDKVDVDLVLLFGYEVPLLLVGGKLLRRREPLFEEDFVDIGVSAMPLLLLLRRGEGKKCWSTFCPFRQMKLRRKLVHGEHTNGASQIALSVRALAENFAAASDKSAEGKRNPWTRPPPGYTKLNVDASFDPDLLQGSVGAVLHDNAGKFIAASNSVIGVCLDVYMAEAIALRFGLNLATSVGCNKLVVNSDNTDVIASMQEGGNSSRTAAAILDDCNHMARDFTHVRYDHCHRKANSVADELARICKFSSPNSWFKKPPSAITPLLVRENVLITR